MVLTRQCHCKTRPNHREIAHPGHSEKSWLEVIMKVVVFFCIFDAIGAMVLLISLEQIELKGCTCAEIEAPVQ